MSKPYTNRRRMIYIALTYIGIAVGYIIIKSPETHSVIASSLINIGGFCIVGYGANKALPHIFGKKNNE